MSKETVVTVNELPPKVVAAIKSGQKIEAIKLLRIETGLGLANAKVLVDAGVRLHGVPSRHSAMMQESGGNNALLSLFLLLLIAFGAYQYFLT